MPIPVFRGGRTVSMVYISFNRVLLVFRWFHRFLHNNANPSYNIEELLLNPACFEELLKTYCLTQRVLKNY
jgi:hypothetical protein